MKTRSKMTLALAVSLFFTAPVFAVDAEKALDDTAITTKVKAELAKESPTSVAEVHVETKNGVVYLTGKVASEVAKEKAEKEAQMVKGVSAVKNELRVK